MKLWLVIKSVENGPNEIQGIFDSEEKALSACHGWGYGLGPLILNQELPAETTKWEGFYYP